ncbi:exported hypothetical protein [uncultured Desulfatiglans sp.]|uniref:Uncharacterized protein n=1 Tax=Uncultured Desulfatiglans sp. TaxID=1748965 RepID=A0A653A0J8_UNCDX|nr:exported hypothetical protein [uncultured Desulfatiglans sp.]
MNARRSRSRLILSIKTSPFHSFSHLAGKSIINLTAASYPGVIPRDGRTCFGPAKGCAQCP